MSGTKISNILSLIEIAENNIKNARLLLTQLSQEKGFKDQTMMKATSQHKSVDESSAIEVTEGYFDGENMIGDNGQLYPVPQNYASKSQLVIGDRMKWILTAEREIFKLIQPAPRERITGTFSIEGDNYVVLTDQFPDPIKILKASATYAMKNLGLQIGNEVVLIVPKDVTPSWGAFSSVAKSQGVEETNKLEELKRLTPVQPTVDVVDDLDDVNEFTMNDEPSAVAPVQTVTTTADNDYF